MDFAYLFNILLRRKWLLLSVAALAAIATWFFVGQLPPKFKVESVISSGIIDSKDITIQRDNPLIQKFQIESEFNMLIEQMLSRSNVKRLSDKLLQHDLVADRPFREIDREELEMGDEEFNDIVQKLKTNHVDTVVNERPVIDRPSQKLAEALGYDFESLVKKLKVERIGDTDYLKIQFESESRELCYFVVKNFVNDFLQDFENRLLYDENMAVQFYSKQMQLRKNELDSMVNEINIYKRENGLIDVSTQRESVIGHSKDLELKLEETRQEIGPIRRNIQFLEKQIAEYNRVNGDIITNKILFNDDIVSLDEKIKKLQEQKIEKYAAGETKFAALDAKIEELRKRRNRVMDRSVAALPKEERDRIDDRLRELVTEHLDKKLELEFALEAKTSYEQEIRKMTNRAGQLLVDDNHLETLEGEKERILSEYLKASANFDEAKLYAEGQENPLSIVERPEMPLLPEPSHRKLFSAFAGVAGGTLTSILLFLLAFVDTSIRTPGQFQQTTKISLLGYLNQVKLKDMDLGQLFANTQSRKGLETFKENVRKLRSSIESSGAKSFLFVSPKEGEGRSFLVMLLAYALSLNNKKVLIVDTNFKHNTLSELKGKNSWVVSTVGKNFIGTSENIDANLRNIDIVANKGGSQSPSEVLAGKNFEAVMEKYASKYDFIFLEAASMNKFSDSRELLPYVEKLVAVVSSESPMGSTDKDTLQYLQNIEEGKMFGGILNQVDMKNI